MKSENLRGRPVKIPGASQQTFCSWVFSSSQMLFKVVQRGNLTTNPLQPEALHTTTPQFFAFKSPLLQSPSQAASIKSSGSHAPSTDFF